MDTLRAELAVGREPDSTRTVAEYLAEWLETERTRGRPSTWRYREGHVRLYIVPTLGSVKLGVLTPRDVERMTAVEYLTGDELRQPADHPPAGAGRIGPVSPGGCQGRRSRGRGR